MREGEVEIVEFTGHTYRRIWKPKVMADLTGLVTDLKDKLFCELQEMRNCCWVIVRV